MRTIYSCPVLGVFGIMIGLYYVYLDGSLLLLPLSSILLPSILFHLTLLLTLWSYLATVICDPGTIPSNFLQMMQELIDQSAYNDAAMAAANTPLFSL
jgi:hypothetical protein